MKSVESTEKKIGHSKEQPPKTTTGNILVHILSFSILDIFYL